MAMYVQITKREFDAFARQFALKVVETKAKELCYERALSGGVALRVWSSITKTGEVARGKGTDAMRVQLVSDGKIVAYLGSAARVENWQKRMTKLCQAAVEAAPAAARQAVQIREMEARVGSLSCPTCNGQVKAVVGRRCGPCFVCAGKPRCKTGGWLPASAGAPEPKQKKAEKKAPGCSAIPDWWAELIDPPARFDTLDKSVLHLALEGDCLRVTGGATFRCRRLLRQFGLEWSKPESAWKGPARKLEERRALVRIAQSQGVTVTG